MSRADKRSTFHQLNAAHDRLRDADTQLRFLADATAALHSPAEASAREEGVRSPYLAWLVFARQVAVSIDEARKAAGKPPEFQEWWDSLRSDERHKYFWMSRNDGLKNGDQILGTIPIVDPELGEYGYFAFADGPFAGDPLVARCQQYTEWLYTDCLCIAQERLHEYFREDAAEHARNTPFF